MDTTRPIVAGDAALTSEALPAARRNANTGRPTARGAAGVRLRSLTTKERATRRRSLRRAGVVVKLLVRDLAVAPGLYRDLVGAVGLPVDALERQRRLDRRLAPL